MLMRLLLRRDARRRERTLGTRGAASRVGLLAERLESRTLFSVGLAASAQMSLVSTTGTAAHPVYHYELTLKDTGTTSIGTFWMAWVPGEDFLPSVPLSQSNPAGWANSLSGSGDAFDGSSIMWVAQSPAAALTAGKSLSGFAFSSPDSPAALAGRSPTHSTTPVLTSFVYSGTPFSDAGYQFVVAPPAAPSAATKLALAAQPTRGTAGAASSPSILVDVESAAGSVVASDTSKVTLAIASGPAGAPLGGTVTVPAVKGVATFNNVRFTVAGAYTLRATDGTLTAAISKSIAIVPSAASKVVIAAQPTTGIAGKTLNPAVAVKVEDAFGNVVTSNASAITIALASGPAGGSLAGTLRANAINGIATFSNLSMKVTGAYTLEATDGALTGAISKPISIAAAAAAKLVITRQPISGKAGLALSPPITVNVEDLFGNVVTANASTISLALISGPAGGTLGGTSSVKAVRGVAIFSNLTLKKRGTYTFKVTDGLLTPAVSKPILVT